MKEKNILLALVGMSGSGKSSVSKFLKEKNWEIIRLEDITTKELTSQNMVINESNEKIIREKIREIHGKEAYAKLSTSRINQSIKEKNTVIDGLYSWSEYKFLKKELDRDFRTILIFTNKSLRYLRLIKRKDRSLSVNEAVSRDMSEIENSEKGGPIAFADYVLVNNGTLDELKQNLEKILNKI